MDFLLSPLKKGFVLGKPIEQKNYDESEIYRLEKENNLIITRKRDGWKIYTVIDKNGEVHLYTAGNNEVDGRLDHIKKDIASLLLPRSSMLAGEVILPDKKDNDDLTKIISVMQGDYTKAMATQRKYGFASITFFGVVFYNSLNMFNTPYHSILGTLQKNIHSSCGHVRTVDILDMSFDEAKKLVKRKGWEGLVLYDKNFRNSYRLDGKAPKRPKGCYKWKPISEDDFIVREFTPSPGDPSRMKDVILLQIDPNTGEEFECGKLGTFTREMKEFLSKKEHYPLVMQVEFESRFPKSQKLRSMRFVRLRDDKPIHECIGPTPASRS